MASLSGGGQRCPVGLVRDGRQLRRRRLYYDASCHTQPFVVDETNGTWGTRSKYPARRPSSGGTAVGSVSCAAAGNCAAGGFYVDGAEEWQAFVVDETNGTWGNAIEVPGTATLNNGGRAGELDLVWDGRQLRRRRLLHRRRRLRDRPPTRVCRRRDERQLGQRDRSARIGALNRGLVEVDSISCAAAGNCTVGGVGYGGVFVAEETTAAGRIRSGSAARAQPPA